MTLCGIKPLAAHRGGRVVQRERGRSFCDVGFRIRAEAERFRRKPRAEGWGEGVEGRNPDRCHFFFFLRFSLSGVSCYFFPRAHPLSPSANEGLSFSQTRERTPRAMTKGSAAGEGRLDLFQSERAVTWL